MKKTRLTKSLSSIVCIVLIAAMALFTTGCNDNKQNKIDSNSESSITTQTDITELGEGKTEFLFSVTDLDGKETSFKIHTDKKNVGEALLELNLLSGDEGPYGLYVKTVNGITVDYDKDGKYWAFYVNGEYATSGVDTTEIADGVSYGFKAE